MAWYDGMRILYQVPGSLQHLYHGVVWRGNKRKKCVYLTFDDGPIPEVTPQLLDLLKREDVKATFFMVGQKVTEYPEIKERIRQEGHVIGNHTFNHLKGTLYSKREYMDNVAKADAVLDGTRLFRPPYGRMGWKQKHALRRLGYKICLWDVLTHDYDKNYSAERMFDIIKRYTRNGSIINFHDSIKSNERMLKAVEMTIKWLKEEGYSIDVLSDM